MADETMHDTNDLGRPVGPLLSRWSPRPRPPARALLGQWCRLEPLDSERYTGELYRANSADEAARIWTYLPSGPFADPASYRDWVE